MGQRKQTFVPLVYERSYDVHHVGRERKTFRFGRRAQLNASQVGFCPCLKCFLYNRVGCQNLPREIATTERPSNCPKRRGVSLRLRKLCRILMTNMFCSRGGRWKKRKFIRRRIQEQLERTKYFWIKHRRDQGLDFHQHHQRDQNVEHTESHMSLLYFSCDQSISLIVVGESNRPQMNRLINYLLTIWWKYLVTHLMNITKQYFQYFFNLTPSDTTSSFLKMSAK